MLLYYIRHGTPTYHPDELTPLGHREAEALAHRLATFGIDKIYSSTSTRAMETAQHTCELVQKEPVLLDFANEKYAYQDFHAVSKDGKKGWAYLQDSYKRIFVSPEIRALGDRWLEHPAFEGTRFAIGMERVKRETDAWLSTLGYDYDISLGCYRPTAPTDERVALFAHCGFGLAFLSAVLGIPYPLISTQFTMRTTGMTVIEFADNGGYVIPKVLTFSNDSHLYAEHIPTLYNQTHRF